MDTSERAVVKSEPRRRRSVAEKRRIVEETLEPDASMARVAHPVNGRLFNNYGWGGYLIWSGSPRSMIFIGGRADIYEYGGVLSDYLSIMRLEPHALQLLKKYDVEVCLIRQDAPLGTALPAGRVGSAFTRTMSQLRASGNQWLQRQLGRRQYKWPSRTRPSCKPAQDRQFPDWRRGRTKNRVPLKSSNSLMGRKMCSTCLQSKTLNVPQLSPAR